MLSGLVNAALSLSYDDIARDDYLIWFFMLRKCNSRKDVASLIRKIMQDHPSLIKKQVNAHRSLSLLLSINEVSILRIHCISLLSSVDCLV
jgi:hypothetical protein